MPTGDHKNNNAAYITANRFKVRAIGSNCLDGKPDDKWNFGENCKKGQSSYEPPIDKSEGMYQVFQIIFQDFVTI